MSLLHVIWTIVLFFVGIFVLVGAFFVVKYLKQIQDAIRKSGVGGLTRPCLTHADCKVYGLNSNWICDPPTQQCRIRPYTKAGCQANSDCADITPVCKDGVCQQTVYINGILEGDASSGCTQGLVTNPVFNFCQANIGDKCGNNNDCYSGTCQNGKCKQLNPLDLCPSQSYAYKVCPDGLACQKDKYSSGQYHCQIPGKGNGEEGSFCKTDTECNTGFVCQRESITSLVGICGSREAYYGQFCTEDSQCQYGLRCNTDNKECVFIDVLNPPNTTNFNYCPQPQYEDRDDIKGCIKGRTNVPCLEHKRCAINCVTEIGGVELLTLGTVGPEQNWRKIYPSVGQDVLNFFTESFQINAGVLEPQQNISFSVASIATPASFTYPSFNITLDRKTPTQPSTITASALRACPAIEPPTIATHLPVTLNDVIFKVNYDKNYSAGSPYPHTVTILIPNTNPPVLTTTNTMISLNNERLITDYYVPSSGTPPNTRYLQNNYISDSTLSGYTLYTPSSGDDTSWAGVSLFTMPPPIMGTKSGSSNYASYIADSMRMSSTTMFPQQHTRLHFFYIPTSQEKVQHAFFRAIPFKNNGGLVTLVGVFSVISTDASPRSKIVISTLTLYLDLSDANSHSNNTKVSSAVDGSLLQLVQMNDNSPIVADPQSSIAIYGSVYSFTFMDFTVGTCFPFSVNMVYGDGTKKPRISEAVGTCNMQLVPNGSGAAEVSSLKYEDESAINESVLSKESGKYISGIFHPHSVFRGQILSGSNTSSTEGICHAGITHHLSDFDIIIIDEVGNSTIVGLLFLMSKSNSLIKDTFVATLRFGYTSYTSSYSTDKMLPRLADSKLFTFFYTPDLEEIGGEILDQDKSYNPSLSSEITSWLTEDAANLDGRDITHRVRSPWANEVLTLTTVPYWLDEPVRFHRNPSSDPNRSTDLFIAAHYYGTDDMIIIPILFDSLGSIKMLITPIISLNDELYVLSKVCAPNATDVNNQLLPKPEDFLINKFTNVKIGPLGAPTWIPINSVYVDPLGSKVPVPLDMQAYACESSGYPDGIIYKTRPYILHHGFPDLPPNDDGLNQEFMAFIRDKCPFVVQTFRDVALCTMYLSTDPIIPINDTALKLLRYSWVNTPRMIGPPKTNDPMLIKGVFSTTNKDIGAPFFMGSESSMSSLPGAYRYSGKCIIAGALPFSDSSPYPVSCPDYSTIGGETEATPITIGYFHLPNKVSLVMYNIKISKTDSGAFTAQLVSADTLKFDSGGYAYPIGMSGSPIVVYSACT